MNCRKSAVAANKLLRLSLVTGFARMQELEGRAGNSPSIACEFVLNPGRHGFSGRTDLQVSFTFFSGCVQVVSIGAASLTLDAKVVAVRCPNNEVCEMFRSGDLDLAPHIAELDCCWSFRVHTPEDIIKALAFQGHGFPEWEIELIRGDKLASRHPVFGLHHVSCRDGQKRF